MNRKRKDIHENDENNTDNEVVIEDSKKTKVLVVDDSPTVLKMVSNMLSKGGYSVDIETSGANALEKLKKHTFDIVLMDINMPSMTGLETVYNFRSFESKTTIFRRQRIVAMTSDFSENVIKQIISVGMDSIIPKPFTLQKFKELKFRESTINENIRFNHSNLNSNQNSGNETESFERENNSKILKTETKKKVLIVDDSVLVLKMVSKTLTNAGYIVDTKRNGKDALDSLRVESYDIVLMDINMPEMTGLEASFEFGITHTFQNHTSNKPILIAMTSQVTPSISTEISLAGFNGVIEKPFTLTKFSDVL